MRGNHFPLLTTMRERPPATPEQIKKLRDRLSWDKDETPYGGIRGLAVVALCTGICALLQPYFDRADLIMVYMAGVLFVALQYGQLASILAVVTSIFLFDLIFVPPRWGLDPSNPQHVFSLLVMLVACIITSRLALRVRLQSLVADTQARSALALNELARDMAAARFEDRIAAGLATAVRASFDMPSALLLPDADNRLHDSDGICRDPATGHDALPLAQRVLDSGLPHNAAAPPPGTRPLLLLLQGTGAPLGVLAVRPPPDWSGTAEDHHLLQAFANQAALAIERLVFERKSAEAAVEVETERLRNTMLSGISHDFRTPLTTIVGAATSLQQQDRLLNAEHRATLTQSILDEARRMHALVSDMLDLSRLEEGAVQLNYEWCPADELVEEACEAVRRRSSNHRLLTRVPPDAVVWCDPRLVVQALVNLLDNALRHTPAGSLVQVEVTLPEGAWQLVVSDNGPGVPAGHERDVFKKFYRGRNEPAGSGTGLGLAICMAVARLHQGQISASNAGGARFLLTLPQPQRQAPPMDEAA